MKNILVTGSAGFIGFHLTRRLLGEGHKVTGIDSINDYYDPLLKRMRLEECGIPSADIVEGEAVVSKKYPGYRFIKADLSEEDRLSRIFQKEYFDTVVHLAAQPGARTSVDEPGNYISNNIVGFYHVLEWCRRIEPGHLLYASSSSVYGLNREMPYSEKHMTDSPASLYGATKKSNELMAHAYSHLFGIPMTGLRFFTVYGPWGRPDMVYFLFTQAILEGKPIKVFNEGNLKRDFTYVDDIVKGISDVTDLIPDGDIPHRVFNIGNSQPVMLLDFIHTLEEILGKKADMELLPMQQGDVLETFADTARLEAHSGYKPNTPLKKGLAEFVDWYMTKYVKNREQ